MKIFKFGGASVKDAAAVKNIAVVLKKTGVQDLVVVVSAMGKSTNALERVVSAYFKNRDLVNGAIGEVSMFHTSILKNLFESAQHPVYASIKTLFASLSAFLRINKSTDRDYVYDQVVSYGELLSTTIVSAYLNEIAIANTLLDVRTCIVTNADYRDAKVDWGKTQKKIVQRVTKKGITVTQGFLGAETANNVTTTLGREGSDYTAAIFAHCLNAGSVTIWKDVAGVLNADPRYFDNPTLLKHISYTEAMQLTFYGASVIHPKTLQPLQHKEIPLYVKSFFNPSQPGTRVGKGLALDPEVPCFVLKKEQVLISVSSPGFSFITEKQMGEVFRLLHTFKMKVAVVQSSAVRFSVCAANGFGQLGPLLAALRTTFKVSCHEGVTLCTVRRPGPGDCEGLSAGKTVLLKQQNQGAVHLVIK